MIIFFYEKKSNNKTKHVLHTTLRVKEVQSRRKLKMFEKKHQHFALILKMHLKLNRVHYKMRNISGCLESCCKYCFFFLL